MEKYTAPQAAQPAVPHRLQLTDRRQLSVTGVQEVTAYDAYSATLQTACGTLVIGGEGIRVKNFSAESGEAKIEGEVEYLQYQNAARGEKGRGFLQRLLR